jgi:hypothetical protein
MYTQPVEDVLRLLLRAPQLALARIYAAQNKVGKSIESVGKVITSLSSMLVRTRHTRFAIVK